MRMYQVFKILNEGNFIVATQFTDLDNSYMPSYVLGLLPTFESLHHEMQLFSIVVVCIMINLQLLLLLFIKVFIV